MYIASMIANLPKESNICRKAGNLPKANFELWPNLCKVNKYSIKYEY